MVRRSPEYRYALTTTEDEVDELQHVNNVVYLSWIQDAALAHSSAVGFDMPAYRALGGAFVVRKHEIEFLQPTAAGERIEVVTWVENWRAASSVRKSEVVRTRDGAVVARASTLWAFMSLDSGGPMRIPASVREAFLDPKTDVSPR